MAQAFEVPTENRKNDQVMFSCRSHLEFPGTNSGSPFPARPISRIDQP